MKPAPSWRPCPSARRSSCIDPDDKNRLRFPQPVFSFIKYTYNEAGREIRQFTYYPDGSIRKGRERDYGADNRFLIKDITYTEGGAFQESAEWTYDENGCAKTCDRRYADESEKYILEYEWAFFPLQ